MQKPARGSTAATTIRLNTADREAIHDLLLQTGLTSTSEAIRLAIREAVAKRTREARVAV